MDNMNDLKNDSFNTGDSPYLSSKGKFTRDEADDCYCYMSDLCEFGIIRG